MALQNKWEHSMFIHLFRMSKSCITNTDVPTLIMSLLKLLANS